MLGLAALILAAASANPAPALATTSPWWEKVTYTIAGDGSQQACEYESSLAAAGAGICDAETSSSPLEPATAGSTGAYTKITIERRFTPGTEPDPGDLNPADTLIGGQVMALAIDGTGTVRSCEIVASSGEVRPAYGCDEARAEQFKGTAEAEAPKLHQGIMTILVYGHEEQLA